VAQKKYDEAIETYKEALYINQNYPQAMMERANVYMLQEKLPWRSSSTKRALRSIRNWRWRISALPCSQASNDSATYKRSWKKPVHSIRRMLKL